MVAAHFPRPEPTDRDLMGMAAGRAIDSAMARLSHLAREGRRPTMAAAERHLAELVDLEIHEAGLGPGPELREPMLAELRPLLRAFRKSPLLGLPRPRSRLVLINERVGVYAQPDYWDGRRRFFEVKSFRAIPPREDIRLQLELFQLAFPGLEAVLACFDRHAAPVVEERWIPAPITPDRTRSVLAEAERVASEHGVVRVLEYVDNPIVRYSVPAR